MDNSLRIKTSLIRFIFILSMVCLMPGNSNAQFRVVGYLYNWGNFVNEANAVDYTRVTHVNIAFVNPDINGNLAPTDNLSDVVTIIHNNNSKVLASLGGANATNNWSTLLQTATTRTILVKKISQLVSDYNLDGIDLDVEGDLLDGSKITSGQYEKFVLELGDSLKAKNKLFTAALATWFGYYVTNAAARKFDWINLMSYDAFGTWTGPGQHSSYQFAVDDLVYWRKKVLDKSNLVVGVPSYGYKWTGNTSSGSSSQSYKNIVASYSRAVNQDSIKPTSAQVIYYNGVETIKSKTQLALKSASGVMMWTLQFDLPTTNPNSLILAIDNARITSIEDHEYLDDPVSVAPNPFSESTKLNFQLSKSGFTKITLTNVLTNSPYEISNGYLTEGNTTIEISGNGLASGLYFLNIQSNDKQKVIKIIKE